MTKDEAIKNFLEMRNLSIKAHDVRRALRALDEAIYELDARAVMWKDENNNYINQADIDKWELENKS